MVLFCSARKLNSYLVRAKLYPLERTVGSYKCKSKQCQVCNNITEADSFTCSNDQTNVKINHRFDYNERCLIYLITCNRCLKQYVGQTVDEFRHMWNNYKDNARKFERGEQCMQRQLYEHFGPVVVVSGSVSLFYNNYYYYYIFILRFFLIPCGYVRYYLV